MKKLLAVSALVCLGLPAIAATVESAPGNRPANTTSAPLDTEGKGRQLKVRPARNPTDPSAPMETTAPVDRNGAVPAERRSVRTKSP